MNVRLVPILIALAAPLTAQDTFAELWKKHAAGEDVAGPLAELARSEQATARDRFNANYLLAVTALGRGELDRAVERLDAAEAARPGTSQVKVRRAEVTLMRGDHEAARKELEQAARAVGRSKSPMQLRCAILLARLDGKTGRAERGIRRLAKLAARHKKNAEIHFFLGHLHETVDEPRDALEAYEKAIRHLPESGVNPAVYAYQRWAALAVSSDKGSYGNPKLLAKATDYYKKFLARAETNRVPASLVAQVESMLRTIKMFTSGGR